MPRAIAGLEEGRGPRILFLSMRGWSNHLLTETTLAHAARLRGAIPIFATCGGRLPVCDAATRWTAPPMPCTSCSEYAIQELTLAGYPPIRISELINVGAEVRGARARVAHLRGVAEMERFEDGGLVLGQLVRVSVAWFLSRGTLPDTPEIVESYRGFLISGQVLRRAFEAMLDRVAPERVTFLNGTLFAEKILGELARTRGLGMTTYENGFNQETLVVTPDRPAAELLVDDESWESASRNPLTPQEDAALERYLADRELGERLADRLGERGTSDPQRIRSELSLGLGRPLVVLYSNVIWDSAVQGKDLAFDSMGQWVTETIAWFASMPLIDLVVRIHPAEVKLRYHHTDEQLTDVISAHIPTLPSNVRVLGPASEISSYSLMSMASVGLVYTSTVGLEMATRGKPVVVAAETHYRARGFTYDAGNPDEYFAIVARLAETPSDSDVAAMRELARRYAFLFFMRFMQEFPLVHETSRHHPRLGYEDVAELMPGRDAALDRISASIMFGSPVVTPPAV